MEHTRILIVEDEPKVAAFIKKGLEENGFIAEVAIDGAQAKNLAFTKEYDLIVLDINIPVFNGYQVCRMLRDHNIEIPVIILTAHGSLEEKVKGFDAGADDYLLKPFEFVELMARVRALLKRTHQNPPKVVQLKIADLQIDRDAKSVSRGGKHIDLSAKEYMLLEYLALNKGRVISRAELTEQVWDVNFETGTNVVDVYINFLRKKIDAGFDKRLIHTRVGMGYMLKEDEE